MNVQKQEKIQNRLNVIQSVLDQNKMDLNQMSALFGERSELQYKLNKANINFVLKGKNKYYYATHCRTFTENLLKFGYGRKTSDEIKKSGISFNDHSINFGYSTYCEDLKRFETKTELLGFVIGYNAAISNLKDKTYSM